MGVGLGQPPRMGHTGTRVRQTVAPLRGSWDGSTGAVGGDCTRPRGSGRVALLLLLLGAPQLCHLPALHPAGAPSSQDSPLPALDLGLCLTHSEA